MNLVGAMGLEPISLATADFKSAAYANSATPPLEELVSIVAWLALVGSVSIANACSLSMSVCASEAL